MVKKCVKSFFINVLLFLNGFLIVSCGEFRKIEKSNDWKKKYDAAIKYYENKDYSRSGTLFEQILPIVRGLPEGEKTQFYLAYTNFYQNYFLLASHHFKTFYETYGRSEFALEARYMYAYSLYSNSPDYDLDQSSSMEAIQAMQNFMNRYPDSEYRSNASLVINELQVKLEKKNYVNAKHYYKLEYYKAAVIAFEEFANNFPDSEYNEEIAYLKFLAEYKLALKSVYSKQEERYRLANEFYIKFLEKYPNSEYLEEAEKYYGDSLKQLNKIATNS